MGSANRYNGFATEIITLQKGTDDSWRLPPPNGVRNHYILILGHILHFSGNRRSGRRIILLSCRSCRSIPIIQILCRIWYFRFNPVNVRTCNFLHIFCNLLCGIRAGKINDKAFSLFCTARFRRYGWWRCLRIRWWERFIRNWCFRWWGCRFLRFWRHVGCTVLVCRWFRFRIRFIFLTRAFHYLYFYPCRFLLGCPALLLGSSFSYRNFDFGCSGFLRYDCSIFADRRHFFIACGKLNHILSFFGGDTDFDFLLLPLFHLICLFCHFLFANF